MEQFVKQWLFDPVVGRLITAVLAIVAVIVLIRFFHRAFSRHIQDADTRYRARKFVTFIGYILGILLLAAIFSDKLGGLHIAFGVAGAGIAFALQEVIMSIAGWFTITFSRFYKTGDRVQLGGITGDVIDIGLLRTTLMEVGDWVRGDLYNGRVVRVANSFVFKDPVFNYSGDFPFLWDEITVPIKYGSDYQFAQELLQQTVEEVVGEYAQSVQKAWREMVKKFMIEPERLEPFVTLTANESWMTFTVRYVVDYKKRRTTQNRLFIRILEEVDRVREKVAIASTSMDINLVQTPTRQVDSTT